MGPHRLWSDSRASAPKRRRVAAGLTLAEEARTVPCSVAQAHRAEQRGVGSPALWRRLAQIVGCRVDEIRPPTQGFKWKRATTAATEPAPEAAAAVESDAAVIVRLRTAWARTTAARVAVRQAAEARIEEEDRQRAERERQRMLAIIARQGSFFPGDELDDPRTLGPEGTIWREDDTSGNWFGWFRL